MFLNDSAPKSRDLGAELCCMACKMAFFEKVFIFV